MLTDTLFWFLPRLKALNYSGPVGVIGFGIRQPAKKHLKQSIDYWRGMDREAPGSPTPANSNTPFGGNR